MTNRKSAWILVGVGVLLLALPWPNLAAETPLPPRARPEFRDLFSGVVVIDPALANVPGPGADPVLVRDWLRSAVLAVPTGTNVLCNQDATTEHQNEPSIAVNPHDPFHVIASSNDYRLKATSGDVHPGYYVSFDGGQTWVGDGVIDLSPIPGVEAGGDPAMVIYDLSNVYFAYIAFHRTVDDVGGVFVSKSTDGGMTWLDPVEVAGNTLSVFHDKEYITVDATGGAYDGNVYVSWTRFEFSSPIYFSRSTDGGASFSTPMEISDPGYSSNQGSIPSVGPSGEVYVAWYNYTTGGHRIAVSQDGGQTFSNRYPVASVNPIPSPLPGASFRDNSFPTLATDKSNGNLYVAWNDYASGDADILFVRSTDGGQSWSAPIRVNDDPYGNDLHQFFPWLSVAPNGNVYAGWFDSRRDPTPYAEPFIYDEYVAMSTDGGLTFGPNVRISEVSSDASVGFNGSFIGDYSGIAATNDFVFPTWVDTRRGHQDIFTQAHPPSSASAKHAPAAVDRGQVFTYTIVLSNANQVDEAYLSDPLPPEVAFVPGSLWASGGSYGQSAGVVTWTGTLSAGLALTITFQVTPTAVCGSLITNTAFLTDGTGALNEALVALTSISGSVPQAGFVPSDWTPELGQVITFTNYSTGIVPLEFHWSFGDGETSDLASPTHAYTLPGNYTVVLTASDACGSDSHAETLTVTCAAPETAFSWVESGLRFTFTNATSSTFPASFAWDFGDGITSTLAAPTHTYALPGSYTVTLVAGDLCGSNRYSEAITATCQAPSPAFGWLAQGLAFSFTNATSSTFPASFAWDLGDGFTSTLAAPSHTYALPGPYTVTLVASDPCGSTAASAAVTATCAAPRPAFTWTAGYLVVTFTNQSTGTFPLAFEWDLGDGTTSTLAAPAHTYALPGSYTVTLVAGDLCGRAGYSAAVQVEREGYSVYLPLVFRSWP